ncbi:hypothetical protein MBM_08500 [Drepanopeziza brunnea f. sp. 'multigermtubi' MB_m1]|uniref:Uncharacterized protein n=1 Tax=Marssonina brunnea f. sp. multigermtubi (strain MB_m1) TaxID=1072389 RepID=K1WM53_MARBU|nr:uncharacterized protein MBM_08500 [Drepanopeziza brunnea f. sp. 'multigermtubi' MB_m1]EKD13417.1 hypothetical protein MBM_08500 [Drepanopeziza brunnea f. sp. 'multigermtubi' MB_m1]
MASLMGSDVTPSGLRFQFNDRIRPVGNRMVEMRAAGEDAKHLNLDGLYSAKGSKRATETARVFGTDATPKAITHQVAAMKLLGKKQVEMLASEISNYFGSDSTGGGIGFQFRAIKHYAKLQKECFDAGLDPLTLNIGAGGVTSGGKNSFLEMARVMGSDTTGHQLEWQFLRFKAGARSQMFYPGSGRDPKNAPGGFNPFGVIQCSIHDDPHTMAVLLHDGTTAAAIEHQFRPLRKGADAMKAAMAVRLNDGTSEYALQHAFRPIKKQAAAMNAGSLISTHNLHAARPPVPTTPFPWVDFSYRHPRQQQPSSDPEETFANGCILIAVAGEDGGSARKTPSKPRTPAKKSAKSMKLDNDDDEDDEEEVETPTKKSALHKTKGGRVQKKSTPKRAAAAKAPRYAESEDDFEEDKEVDERVVKDEIVKDDDDMYGVESPTNKDNGNTYHEDGGDDENETEFNDALEV